MCRHVMVCVMACGWWWLLEHLLWLWWCWEVRAPQATAPLAVGQPVGLQDKGGIRESGLCVRCVSKCGAHLLLFMCCDSLKQVLESLTISTCTRSSCCSPFAAVAGAIMAYTGAYPSTQHSCSSGDIGTDATPNSMSARNLCKQDRARGYLSGIHRMAPDAVRDIVTATHIHRQDTAESAGAGCPIK